MNQNQPIDAELIDSDALPSGHCAVKLLIRNCNGISPGDTLNVIAYDVKASEEDGE